MPVAQIACPLWQAAQRWPRQPALEEGGLTVSFADLEQQVAGLCGQLSRQGVAAGDRLALVTSDRGALVRWLLAALRLKLTAVVINPGQPDDALSNQLQRAAPRWRVAERSCDDEVSAVWSPRLFESCSGDSETVTAIDSYLPFTGVFTSGSSGTPKLALHCYANHYASARGSQSLIPLRPGDRWAAVLPFHHVGGLALIFRCLLAGACLQIPASERTVAELVTDSTTGPTHLSAVGTQLLRLRTEGVRLDGGCLRTLLLGGSAFSPQLLDWLEPQRLQVLISYGLTEMSSQVMTGLVNPDGLLATLLPGRELMIAADGEILVRGDTLFLGYDEDGVLRRPLDETGWFHTRDLGALTATGLKVQGRLDNQFISGGENIQPEEIEGVIAQYPGVSVCVVVPVADAEFGQRPVALVAGLTLPDQAEPLRQWLRKRLPGYKVPIAVLALPEQEGALKVQRSALLRWAAEQIFSQ
ncbi:AMP-binding protein [Motiliproteus sediminis]|uniref:AMP-binding protein n=1 Tax=Motiliproteus sediminis TaxID=1468178 RepID=UPI001AF01398|nr:AMP-binding protein [Motiliproteus sediminis]